MLKAADQSFIAQAALMILFLNSLNLFSTNQSIFVTTAAESDKYISTVLKIHSVLPTFNLILR